jgi:hypothetical protein
MLLREIRQGTYRIYAIATEQGCPVADFLEDLKTKRLDLYKKIMALINYTATHGPPRNEEKCRMLNEYDGFELKASQVRIMAFWDKAKEKVIICTHGFIKKKNKTDKNELKKLKETRQLYLAQ